MATIQQLFKDNEQQIQEDFFTFLQFQSISTDSKYASEVHACAEWLLNYLKAMGFTVELWPTIGHPTLFATHMHAGPDQPTLLIYNHYDVQPIDPLNEWHTPPFEPTIKGKEIYARGAQDNKGQCFYTLQALKLLLQRGGKLPINIKLCIEGEEETGSPGLAQILSQKQEALRADYLVVVDVGIPERNTPAVTLGTRGLVSLDVEVCGSTCDLHSGSHGGLAYNPIRALVELLSSLYEPSGRVAIPEFYADVSEINQQELAQLTFDFNEQDYEKTFGASPTGGERGRSALERNWLQPTLEINGITGGYSGQGLKTVIPAKASAKISCRLVPNQDPEKIGSLIKNFLVLRAPAGISVKAQIHSGRGLSVRALPSSKLAQAFAKAYETVFEKPCRFIYSGATIPIAPELAKASQSEIVFVGLGLPDDQIHAPNEHFGWDRIQQGVQIIAEALEQLKS